MIKYVDTLVVFREVPDEITLAINISNCPVKCEGCHSPYLMNDVGNELTTNVLSNLFKHNKGITCVCFMGGDKDPKELNSLLKFSRDNGLKTCWYSGKSLRYECGIVWSLLDYIKIGPYIKDKGPISQKSTNQRFYKIGRYISQTAKYVFIDQTYKFWNNEVED